MWAGRPEEIAEAAAAFAGRRGYRALSPFFVPRVLGASSIVCRVRCNLVVLTLRSTTPNNVPLSANLAAGNVSTAFNLRGPNIAPATACAAGAHAIGDAFRLIKNGDADVMLAGGTEAAVSLLQTHAA